MMSRKAMRCGVERMRKVDGCGEVRVGLRRGEVGGGGKAGL
jgi:hypothetical protein